MSGKPPSLARQQAAQIGRELGGVAKVAARALFGGEVVDLFGGGGPIAFDSENGGDETNAGEIVVEAEPLERVDHARADHARVRAAPTMPAPPPSGAACPLCGGAGELENVVTRARIPCPDARHRAACAFCGGPGYLVNVHSARVVCPTCGGSGQAP